MGKALRESRHVQPRARDSRNSLPTNLQSSTICTSKKVKNASF